jgi:hypothetical protein
MHNLMVYREVVQLNHKFRRHLSCWMLTKRLVTLLFMLRCFFALQVHQVNAINSLHPT